MWQNALRFRIGELAKTPLFHLRAGNHAVCAMRAWQIVCRVFASCHALTVGVVGVRYCGVPVWVPVPAVRGWQGPVG